MALAPATIDLMRQSYPQLQLQPMAPPSLAPPLSPDAAAAQQRLSGAPPLPAAAPLPAAPPLAPMRPPGPPKAPPGTVLAQEQVTPGVDTSAARAANTAAAEREATATEKAGADMAAAARAEAEGKAAGQIAQYQQATMQAEARNDLKRAADAHVTELLAQKDPEVDPKKYFKDLGLGGTALAIAAAGVTGALRAVANNKSQVAGQDAPYDMNQNPVVDAIQAQVRQSIELQRDAIANGRADRAQALNIEMQRWGNADQASLALQSRAMDALARYNDAKAEAHRGTAIEANARQNAEAARARATQLNGQLSLMEQERRSYTFERPKPVAGAGAGAASLGKWGEIYDAEVKRGRSKEDAAMFASAGTGVKLPPPAGESKDEKDDRIRKEEKEAAAKTHKEDKEAAAAVEAEKKTAAEGAASSVRAAFDELGGEVGFKRVDGKWSAGDAVITEGTRRMVLEKLKSEGPPLDPLQAVAGAPPGLVTPIKNRRGAAIEALGRLQSQGVISPTEETRFAGMLGAATGAQLADQLNVIEAIVYPRLKAPERREAEAANRPPGTWK